MGIKSFIKSIINMWPMYRQGERQSLHLQNLVSIERELLHWHIREKLMKDDILKMDTEKGEIQFYLPPFPQNCTSVSIITTLSFAEHDLLAQTKKYIHKDSIVADVGANIGNHTLYFSFCLAPAKVYAFEPQKTMFKILQKNCELNKLQDKVQLYNCCLGEKEAFADLDKLCTHNAGEASFTASSVPTEYKMISLDSLQLERLDFMKIDVEGHELDVLKGAAETIKKCKPVIWCEAWSAEHKNSLYNYLKNYGYSISQMGESNFLFVPKQAKNIPQ